MKKTTKKTQTKKPITKKVTKKVVKKVKVGSNADTDEAKAKLKAKRAARYQKWKASKLAKNKAADAMKNYKEWQETKAADKKERVNTDTIRMTVDLCEKEIGYLYHTECNSFISEQAERFVLASMLTLSELRRLDDKSCNLYFTSSYVEAKLIASYYRKKGFISAILVDGIGGDFVAWVKK